MLPVYITQTRRKLMGNHAFASFMSKSRKEMSPAVLQPYTTAEHTLLWMQSSRKVMEKCVPETTYWREHAGELSGANAGKGTKDALC